MDRRPFNPKRVACGIGDDVDHGRLALQGLLKAASMSGFEIMQSGLDMLAGAQAGANGDNSASLLAMPEINDHNPPMLDDLLWNEAVKRTPVGKLQELPGHSESQC
jgi:hypothetical protein